MRRTLLNSRKRRAFVSILTLSLIFAPFQNCSDVKTAPEEVALQNSADSNSSANASGEGSGNNSGPSPSPSPNDPNVEYRRTNTPPIITSATVGPVTFRSGLGPRSGNESANLTASITRGGTNPNKIVNLNCNVVSGDATRPFSLSGLDMSGNLVAAQANSVAFDGCNAITNFSNKTFQVQGAMNSKCLRGSFYIRITATDQYDAVSAPRYAQVNVVNNCRPQARLRPSETLDRLDQFGHAVALDGSTAVVLAQGDDGPTNSTSNVGAAYVFVESQGGWALQQKLFTSDGAVNDAISAVALRGSLIALAAPSKSGGVVYVFSRSGSNWSQVARLTAPPSLGSNSSFGTALAFINDTTLAIGAPTAAGGGIQRGSLVLTGPPWSATTVLNSNQISLNYAGLGSSIAGDNDIIVAGAPMVILNENNGSGEVAVFRFVSGAWQEQTKLVKPSGIRTSSKFGAAVAINANAQIAVGAPTAYKNANERAGAVYYYSSFTANPIYLPSPGGDTDGEFGASVAINGYGVFAGAPKIDSRAGVVEIYPFSAITAATNGTANGNQAYRLMSTERKNEEQFGSAINVNGNRVVVGARLRADPTDGQGASYVIQHP